jgi:hypothetical protein
MPGSGINKRRLAKTTGEELNCGVNALVHEIRRNLLPGRERIPLASLDVFRDKFNRFYGSDLSSAEFKTLILSIEDPVDREIILGRILRSMFRHPPIRRKLTADRRDEVLNPGVELEDPEVAVMANFFGIRVEAYAAANEFVRSGFEETLSESERRRVEKIDNLHEIDQDAVLSEIWAKNTKDAPVLKLWNRSGHYEYEEDSDASADEHNRYYDNYSRFYYRLPPSKKIQAKVRHELRLYQEGKGPLKLSPTMSTYAKNGPESVNKNSNFSGVAQSGNLGSSNGSDLMQRIMQAFLGPFQANSGSSSNSSLGLENGNAVSQDKNLSSMLWVQILSGVTNFILNLSSAFSGIASLVPEINRRFNPGQDLISPDFDKHPEAKLFAEFVGLLPPEIRQNLNAEWTECVEKKMSVDGVMSKLERALKHKRMDQEAKKLLFRRKIEKLKDPIFQLHFMQQWDNLASNLLARQSMDQPDYLIALAKGQERLNKEVDDIITAQQLADSRASAAVGKMKGKGKAKGKHKHGAAAAVPPPVAPPVLFSPGAKSVPPDPGPPLGLETPSASDSDSDLDDPSSAAASSRPD